MRVLMAIAIWALAFCGAAGAQEFKGPPWFSAARCGRQDAIAADRDLNGLTNWTALYRAFQLYRQCDDGGIAEGYSDAVAKLLARHWDTLPEFAKLTRTTPQFEQFVFHHLDETVNLKDDLAIVDNALHRCPQGLEGLCRRLATKAKPSNEAPVRGR